MTDLPSRAPAKCQEFYRLGCESVIGLGWIVDAHARRFFGRDPDGNVGNVVSQR